MRKLWIIAAVAVCAVYQSGCESHPPEPGVRTAAPVAKPAAADTRPVIACFGDSLTAGMGLDPGQSFPDLLQRDLDNRGLKYRVENMGVSGDTTQDGVGRLAFAVSEKPAIVILELGANDGLRGQPIIGTRANLAHMIEGFQKAGSKVVLAGITLPPNYGQAYIQQFDKMYLDLTAKYKLTTIPFLLAGVGGNAGLMQKDGLHPNAEGTRIVEANVMKALLPLL